MEGASSAMQNERDCFSSEEAGIYSVFKLSINQSESAQICMLLYVEITSYIPLSKFTPFELCVC